MTRLIVYIVIGVILCGISSANGPVDCPDWRTIYSTLYKFDRFSWQPLKELRSFVQPCTEHENFRSVAIYLGTFEGKVGNHSSSLRWFDQADTEYVSTAKPLNEFTVVEAIPYIIDRSKNHQIVITNERHHVSTDRLLPLSLLAPLYEQGFRYLAVETLAADHSINELGYPTVYDGYYSNDVVYAQLLRSARDMGYKIVAYEIEDDQKAPEDPKNPINRYDERDSWQAKNIISRTFDADPEAKVLIHCGYGHVSEGMLTRSTPMARFLKDYTGLDPLTIGQTHFSERYETEREHPWRRQAASLGLLGDTPRVLMNPQGNLIRDLKSIDIEVIGLQTRYKHGRPIWMSMGGIRQPISIDTPKCVNRSCVIEAFDPEEDEYAIPYDRLEVDHSTTAVLYVPPWTPLNIRIMDLDANVLGLRSVSAD